MDFAKAVKIVDMPMGSGKTTATINYINEHPEKRFIYITQFMDEITNRILPQCNNFYTPINSSFGTKLKSIKYLMSKGYNIASTHALFLMFDLEAMSICKEMDYVLIMDEVVDVIEQYPISKFDLELFLRLATLDEETGFYKWNDTAETYNGKFDKEKKLCEMGSLAESTFTSLTWVFPVDIFNAFDEVYILTYMFSAQIQKYYYDLYDVPYEYIYTKLDNGEYKFTTDPAEKLKLNYDYNKLIHICENDKMNKIGSQRYDLSKSWYENNKNNIVMNRLRLNLKNWFSNINHCKSKELFWTTFKDYKKYVQGLGYTKSFLASNMRSINSYSDRKYIAYTINKFLNSNIKQFFAFHNIKFDEDKYALSEMLQFIWRSAIRRGEEIYVYVPSARMRGLLKEWINENSCK